MTVWREEQIYTQRFDRGIPVTEFIVKPSLENRTGTSVTFKPDSDIFKISTEFDCITLAIRLQELAYLNAGIKITLSDRRLELFEKKPLTEVYHYPGGIREYLTVINFELMRTVHRILGKPGKLKGDRTTQLTASTRTAKSQQARSPTCDSFNLK